MSPAPDPAGAGYRVVSPAEVHNWHEDAGLPGEFRQLTDALGTRELAASFVVVPPHTDFERGTAHRHQQLEELYLISEGVLTMRCEEEVLRLQGPICVRVDPSTWRSHRNEDDEPVRM